jgi:hypothetical protein
MSVQENKFMSLTRWQTPNAIEPLSSTITRMANVKYTELD